MQHNCVNKPDFHLLYDPRQTGNVKYSTKVVRGRRSAPIEPVDEDEHPTISIPCVHEIFISICGGAVCSISGAHAICKEDLVLIRNFIDEEINELENIIRQ